MSLDKEDNGTINAYSKSQLKRLATLAPADAASYISKLERRLEIYKEALQFYAQPGEIAPPNRARQALKEAKEV